MPSSGRDWYKLDNAAKIIPSSVEGADTRVFRLVCELKEPVDPVVLQNALDKTLPEYPYMSCRLCRGVFWFYLNSWKEKALVEEESLPALAPLYKPGRKSFLFRVIYFQKRISLEVFHVLTDGTGGYIFLVTLLTHYLAEKYGLDEAGLEQDVTSIAEKEADAFIQFYEDRKQQRQRNKEPVRRNYIKEMFPTRAYQIKGDLDEDLREHLLEGMVSTSRLLETAHGYGVTVGELVTSLYVEAILSTMSMHDRKKPIVVSVPVNLRQFFVSSTTRNFYGTIQVDYDPAAYDGTLESILKVIHTAFREKLTRDKIFDTMNSFAALEHNYAVKMVPLFLKFFGIRGINYLMKTGVTTSVSNLGRIEVPEQMIPYIDRFSCYMSCRKASICFSSFQDKTVLGAVSCFTGHDVFMHLFRRLTELGIPVELGTNDHDAEVD